MIDLLLSRTPSGCRYLLLTLCLAGMPCIAHANDHSSYPLLRESLDKKLQQLLEQELQAEFKDTRKRQISRKKLSLVIVDVTDLHQPRVAEVNGDSTLYAASLPKIAILLGAYVQAARGELVIDEKLRDSMTRMIRNSSNRDASAVLDLVGFENLAAILQSERYQLYDPEHGGGLWVGRDYGGGNVWRKDPLKNISHAASAMQVARFYYLLWTDRLATPGYSKEMREILSEPKLSHKFVKGLKQESPEARIARKSGTWRNFHADSGVVESGHGRFIIVAIGEHPEGGADLERLIVTVERAFKKAWDADN